MRLKFKLNSDRLLIRIVLLLSIIFAYNNVKAQSNRGIVVNGTVLEEGSNNPLPYATVALLTEKDSTFVTGTVSNDKGGFVLKNVPVGDFKLKITFIGYGTLRKKVNIVKATSSLNIGTLILAQENKMMQEVVINGNIPVVVKKDTVEYNANMFKTDKNAVVEDMLKKMPGIEVDNNGKIKAQGKAIARVYVDGKPFFGNDPLIATQNLPSEMIAKIQVIDKKSDQAVFTNIDDGITEKVINIVTRQNYKHGNFGKGSLSYGSNNRFDSGLMLNDFNGERKTSLFGNLQRFSLLNTIQRSNRGGLNFHNRYGKNLELSGSYSYTGNDSKNSQTSLTQTLKGDSAIFKHDTTSSSSKNIIINLIWSLITGLIH